MVVIGGGCGGGCGGAGAGASAGAGAGSGGEAAVAGAGGGAAVGINDAGLGVSVGACIVEIFLELDYDLYHFLIYPDDSCDSCIDRIKSSHIIACMDLGMGVVQSTSHVLYVLYVVSYGPRATCPLQILQNM